MILTEFNGSVSFSSSGHEPSRRGSDGDAMPCVTNPQITTRHSMTKTRRMELLRYKKHQTLYNRNCTEATERSHMDRPPATSLNMLRFTNIDVLVLVPSRLNHYVRKMFTSVALTAG